MRDALAIVGLFVVLLLVASLLHIGHFRLYYGHDPYGCTKMEAKP